MRKLLTILLFSSLGLTTTGSQATTWTITDLGIYDGHGMALNDQGWVVSGAKVFSPVPGGYTSTTLLNAQGNTSNFWLRDINNSNAVVGVDASAGAWQAFVWQAGTRHNLPALPNWAGYVQSTAVGINDAGQVVGNTGDTAHIWSPNGSGGYLLTALGVDLGWTIGSGDAAGINNPGAGLMAQVYNSYRTGYSSGIGHTSIIGEQSGYTPVGAAINDLYQVVGTARYNCGPYSCYAPFLWQGSEFTLLPVPTDPTVPGMGITGQAWALNEHQQAVGNAYYAPYVGRAYLWSLGDAGWTARNLDELLPAGSTFYHLADAMDINEHGQIVGIGAVAGDGQLHAFVLSPAVPEPQSWALWLAGLVGLGSVARRRQGRPR